MSTESNIEGIPIRLCFEGIAYATIEGIEVGPKFFAFSKEEQIAILWHEAGHIRLEHGRLYESARELFDKDRLSRELDADFYAASRGYWKEMLDVLKQLPVIEITTIRIHRCCLWVTRVRKTPRRAKPTGKGSRQQA